MVLGHESERARPELKGLRCEVVLNAGFEEGIHSSVRTGIAAVPAGCAAAVVLLADMPLVEAEMVRTLVRRYRDGRPLLVVSDYEGVDAPPILYDRALFAELRVLEGEGCGKRVVKRHSGEAVRNPLARACPHRPRSSRRRRARPGRARRRSMKAELLRLAADLASRRQPFVLAMVVRRQPYTSSQQGDMAIITADGGYHGWLGGNCTQPVVKREAARALADGRPRLLSLSPEAGTEARPGVTVLPMVCQSGGTVDVYLEPVLPPPRLVLFGLSPVIRALAQLGKGLGYSVDVVDPEASLAAAAAERTGCWWTSRSAELREAGAPRARTRWWPRWASTTRRL